MVWASSPSPHSLGSTRVRIDGLEACVRALDPATRALLDLSLRRRMRDDRAAAAIGTLDPPAEFDDPWVAHLDRAEAADLLGRLGEHHRAALTLRYVDGLPVAEVADLLGRTVHATEA